MLEGPADSAHPFSSAHCVNDFLSFENKKCRSRRIRYFMATCSHFPFRWCHIVVLHDWSSNETPCALLRLRKRWRKRCYDSENGSVKAPPDRREIFATTANHSLRILSWTGTYMATSGSPHSGAKKSRRRLRNCSDLFTVAACTVFVAVAANSAGFTFQFRELAPAGDKNVICRHVSFLFRIQSHI